jgi:transglutaminase/protease-like cytokinesis protein 3
MTSVEFDEPEGKHSVNKSVINASVLGQAMQMSILGDSWSKAGRVSRQTYVIESAGRVQKVTAVYGDKEIKVSRESEGATFEKVIAIPTDAAIVEDPTFGAFGKGLPEVGAKQVFYSFDPMLLTLMKNEAEFLGEREFEIDGKKAKGYLLTVTDPRAATNIYLSAKGEFLFGTSVMGITLKPITREEALGTAGYAPSIDIASASRIVPDKPIPNPRELRRLTLRLEGGDLKRLVSDYFQTVTPDGPGALKLVVHPVAASAKGAALSSLAKQQPQFVKPAVNVPVTDPIFKTLAKQVVGSEKDGYQAALKISKYVHKIMRPKATVGMLRDAKEILRTKEGVCRDYATLAVTLMRAAGIPTKVVTGAVYAEGAFYYHAWVEVWNGKSWISLDPTLTGGPSDATHLKFAEGDPEKAFTTFTLDGVKVKVLDQMRGSD